MKKYSKLLVAVMVAMAMFGLVFTQGPREASADTVIGYQSVEVMDGTEAYTTTETSSGYLVGSFGEVVLQVHSDVSGTGTITVTPQFSSEYVGCSSVTNWADATESGLYADAAAASATVTVSTLNTNTLTTTVSSLGGGTTLTYGNVPVVVVLAGDGSDLIRFRTMGRCMRLQFESGTTYTPTAYLWMVNTQ